MNTVRKAGSLELEPLWEFMCANTSENALFAVDYSQFRWLLEEALNGKTSIILVIDGERGYAAVMWLTLERPWYSAEWVLGERWVYVHPDYRNTDCWEKLIDFAKTSAIEMGLPLVMGISTNCRVDAKIRLYRRKLPLIGGLFLFDPRRED